MSTATTGERLRDAQAELAEAEAAVPALSALVDAARAALADAPTRHARSRLVLAQGALARGWEAALTAGSVVKAATRAEAAEMADYAARLKADHEAEQRAGRDREVLRQVADVLAAVASLPTLTGRLHEPLGDPVAEAISALVESASRAAGSYPWPDPTRRGAPR